MSSTLFLSRRRFAAAMAAIPASFAAARAASPAMEAAAPPNGDGLSHSSEAIRQEITLQAAPGRIYEVLTATQQFDAITRLSDGLQLLNAPGAKPTAISPALGGAFTLFGGYITGRHLEMLPGERLVQAWRTASWKPGEFSIASFALAADGAGTRLTFDHRGFPQGQGAHLAAGWHSHYWEPLAKYLSQN